jgi:hypothetical protein
LPNSMSRDIESRAMLHAEREADNQPANLRGHLFLLDYSPGSTCTVVQ